MRAGESNGKVHLSRRVLSVNGKDVVVTLGHVLRGREAQSVIVAEATIGAHVCVHSHVIGADDQPVPLVYDAAALRRDLDRAAEKAAALAEGHHRAASLAAALADGTTQQEGGEQS